MCTLVLPLILDRGVYVHASSRIVSTAVIGQRQCHVRCFKATELKVTRERLRSGQKEEEEAAADNALSI